MAKRLPDDIRAEIRAHGLRNSHLLSIAPTGTISLAFADNASNGIEPAFSWTYTRKKREPDGTMREYRVEDPSPQNGFRECWGDLADVKPHVLDLYYGGQVKGMEELIAERAVEG